jgi:Family of unknown function (DUF5302)
MSPTSDEATDQSTDQPTDKPTDKPTDPQADLRDKFRAALDRKHGKGAPGGDDHASGGSKASARTSNSKTQREFRRKSGG